MSTIITLDYFGMSGSGKTVKEAKLDAGRKIEQALDGEYTPMLVHWRQYTVLVAREPKYGWGYRISHPEAEGNAIVERMYLTHEGDKALTLKRIAHHIGDISRPCDEDPHETYPLFGALISPHHHVEREFQEFERNMRRNYTFQSRYKHAVKVLKLEGYAQHVFAGMDPSRPDVWRGTEELFLTPPWEVKP